MKKSYIEKSAENALLQAWNMRDWATHHHHSRSLNFLKLKLLASIDLTFFITLVILNFKENTRGNLFCC